MPFGIPICEEVTEAHFQTLNYSNPYGTSILHPGYTGTGYCSHK
jgi:hypothetical protein